MSIEIGTTEESFTTEYAPLAAVLVVCRRGGQSLRLSADYDNFSPDTQDLFALIIFSENGRSCACMGDGCGRR